MRKEFMKRLTALVLCLTMLAGGLAVADENGGGYL